MRLRHNYRDRPSRRNTGSRGAWSVGSLAPTLWLDARRTPLGGSAAPNLASSGPALDARYGSTSGVDVTDPVLLPHTGVNYLYLPGGTISANFAAAPNSGTSLGGDVSIAVRYDPTDRTLDAPLLLKRQAGVDSNLAPFNFGQWIVAGGSLKLNWTDTSGGSHTLYASTSVPAAAKWVGVQHDMDNGSGGNTAHFYWSADVTNPTWTLLESVTEAFVDPAGRRVNAAQIGVGGTDIGQHGAVGSYYEAKVWSGLTFTNAPLFHANFTTGITSGGQTTFTESSANAATVTINRSTTGRKSTAVVRPVWLFGTDDYMEVVYDPYTAYVRTLAGVGSIQHTHVTYDSGTATAGAATTLDDTTKTWTVNAYSNRAIRITGGTGVGQVRNVASNTATQITVSVAWTTNPDATSTYVIESKGNVSGDIEIVVKCALDQWANGSNQPLFLKRSTGQWSYYLYSSGTGSLGFSYTLDGSTNQIAASGVAPFVDGTTYWIRVRRTASTGAWTIEYAADQINEPSSWTSLASGTGTAGTIWQGTGLMGVGGNSQVAHTTGKFYVVRVRDGFAGTNVVFWDAAGHDNNGGAYCDGTARTIWTVDGGCTVVNANPLNFGSSESFTVIAVIRQWATPPSFARVVDKLGGIAGGSGVSGWAILNHNANGKVYFTIGDQTGTGSNTVGASTFAMGTLTTITAVRNTTADTVSHYHDNTIAGGPITDASSGAVSNTAAVKIGGTGGAYNDFELVAVAVIPSALTTEQIAQVVAFYN